MHFLGAWEQVIARRLFFGPMGGRWGKEGGNQMASLLSEWAPLLYVQLKSAAAQPSTGRAERSCLYVKTIGILFLILGWLKVTHIEN